MKVVKYLIMAAGLAATIVACKKSASSNSNLFGSYDQQAMLTNIGNNVLVPGLNSFSASSSTVQTAIDSFNAHPDTASLTAAQSAFVQLALNWAAVAPYAFGPLNDNLWSADIDTWPVDTVKIQTAINTQASASAQGSNVKGLKALEYLLYDKSGNTAVVAKYAGSSTAATNRKAYLTSVAQTLSGIASNLQSAWTGGYTNTFITAKGNDVSSSVSLLINSISFYLDQVKNMKVGNPIGMGVKVNDNNPHPDMIEYTITEQSLAVMKANVQSMKNVFDGGANGPGLKDLLDYVHAQQNGQNLSTVIDNAFIDAINKINAITPPYATAVNTQTQQVKNVYTSLKLLIAYFKVDVANNLGVTITFTDADGD